VGGGGVKVCNYSYSNVENLQSSHCRVGGSYCYKLCPEVKNLKRTQNCNLYEDCRLLECHAVQCFAVLEKRPVYRTVRSHIQEN
jgi:hypothetical protein